MKAKKIIRKPFKNAKPQFKPDFQILWTRMMGVAMESSDQEMKSILLNHTTKKEYICRKLGIVMEADILRIQKSRSKI